MGKGALRVGGFFASFDTQASFSPGRLPGITLDAEELLGLDSELAVFRADGFWRFGKRKRNTVDFTYASYNRDAAKVNEQDIDLGNGTILPEGARLDSLFNLDIIRATCTYAFFQDERMNIAAGLGAYIAPIDYGLTF